MVKDIVVTRTSAIRSAVRITAYFEFNFKIATSLFEHTELV
jgi:hypothetical protein